MREKAEVAPPPRSEGPCVSRARGQNLAAAPPLCGGISPSPYTKGVGRCSPCRNESHRIAPAISSELSRRKSHIATNSSRGSRAVSASALRGNRRRRVSRKMIGATLRLQSASKEECRHPHVARGSSYTHLARMQREQILLSRNLLSAPVGASAGGGDRVLLSLPVHTGRVVMVTALVVVYYGCC